MHLSTCLSFLIQMPQMRVSGSKISLLFPCAAPLLQTTTTTTTTDPSSKAELILSLRRSVDPSQCRCQVVMADSKADTPLGDTHLGDRGATLLVSLRFGSASHCVDTLLVDSVDTRWVE